MATENTDVDTWGASTGLESPHLNLSVGHTSFQGQQILLALSFLGPFLCVLDLGLGLNLQSLHGEAGDWVKM